MTNVSIRTQRPVTHRSLRRERLDRLFGSAAADPATETTTTADPKPSSPQFTDPVFASAARDALSADSATFLEQARQTRGE